MALVYFALAFCFTSLRIFTGGRPMAAPTGAIIKPFCHSKNGKIPKTSAGYNRADAISTNDILNPNWPSAKTEHRSSAPRQRGNLDWERAFVYCPSRPYTADTLIKLPTSNYGRRLYNSKCINDRIINNPAPVGASIARPSAAAEMQFAFRTECIFFASARPVITEIVVTALALFPCRCFVLNSRFCDIPTSDNGIILFCTRVLFHIAANFHRRTANGRPYGSIILEHLL